MLLRAIWDWRRLLDSGDEKDWSCSRAYSSTLLHTLASIVELSESPEGGMGWGWQGTGTGPGVAGGRGRCLRGELSPDLQHQRAGVTARLSHVLLPCLSSIAYGSCLGYFCRTSGSHSLRLRSSVSISWGLQPFWDAALASLPPDFGGRQHQLLGAAHADSDQDAWEKFSWL